MCWLILELITISDLQTVLGIKTHSEAHSVDFCFFMVLPGCLHRSGDPRCFVCCCYSWCRPPWSFKPVPHQHQWEHHSCTKPITFSSIIFTSGCAYLYFHVSQPFQNQTQSWHWCIMTSRSWRTTTWLWASSSCIRRTATFSRTSPRGSGRACANLSLTWSEPWQNHVEHKDD